MGCSLLSVTEIFYLVFSSLISPLTRSRASVEDDQKWARKSGQSGASNNSQNSSSLEVIKIRNEMIKVVNENEAKSERILKEIQMENETKMERVLKVIESLRQEVLQLKKNLKN